MKTERVADHVIELETYYDLDYAFAESTLEKSYCEKGGCTCFIKTTDDGQTIAGRNMDLSISNNPAFIVRTKCPGDYETVGISYSCSSGPSYREVIENGVTDERASIIPFLCTDVMNSAGFYIEINMRSDETYPDGRLKFLSTGTNPHAPIRTCVISLTRYLAQHCATVDEALAFVREKMDIYTPDKVYPWGFCFIMGDATGHFGLLEIADNKISWLDGQHAQTNFYLTPEFAEIEDLKCGLGRYATVMEGIEAVQSEDDAFKLIDSVSYFQVYQEHPHFDVRSEFSGVKDHWTSKYLEAEENRNEISEHIARNIKKASSMSRQELQDTKSFWESVFTVVANCNSKTLKVRFFEDNARIFTLSV